MALQGAGGGQLGIIVSMIFKVPPKISKVTLLSIEYPEATLNEQIEVFDVLQNMLPTLDRRINFRVSIYNSVEEKRGIYIVGLFYGTKDEALEIIEPLKNISSNVEITSEYTIFLQAVKEIGTIYQPYEKFKSMGRFVYDKYSRNEIKEILKFIKERSNGSIFTAVTIYGLGGAVNDVDKNSTAFYYRGCQYILGIQTVWEEYKYKKENEYWFKNQYNRMKKFFTGAYVNFPYAGIENYEEKYYGCHIDRLTEIKNKYDPYNIFKFPQSIKI